MRELRRMQTETSCGKRREADKVPRSGRLTFLTLFLVIDSTANTWSPIDDSSIATRCCDTGRVRAVVVQQLFICVRFADDERRKNPAECRPRHSLRRRTLVSRLLCSPLQTPASFLAHFLKCATHQHRTPRCFKSGAPPFSSVRPSPQRTCRAVGDAHANWSRVQKRDGGGSERQGYKESGR